MISDRLPTVTTMNTRCLRPTVVLAIVVAAGLSACGSDDDGTTAPAASAEAADEQVPTETTGSPDENSGAELPSSDVVFDGEVAICDLLNESSVAIFIGADAVSAMAIGDSCLWSNGETGDESVAVGAAVVPTQYAGTLEEGCARTDPYSDVESTSIGGFPGFTGIDQGSDDFTAKVCIPDQSLTVSGLATREQAVALAAALMSAA